MTRDELDHRWATALGVAEAVLLKDGALHSAFLVVGSDGRSGGPLAADFSTQIAREDTYALLRLACIEADAVLVIYMGEAEAAAGDVLSGDNGVSGIEARVDVLVISSVASVEGEDRLDFRTMLRQVQRGADGRATGLCDLSLPRSAHADEGEPDGVADAYAGPLADVLPRARPTAAERRGARETLAHAAKRRGRGQTPFAR